MVLKNCLHRVTCHATRNMSPLWIHPKDMCAPLKFGLKVGPKQDYKNHKFQQPYLGIINLAVTAVILSAAALHSPSLLSAHRRCFLLTATALCSSMMDHSCVVAG
ncbi:hypothetical protein ACSBR2_017992 [Camellia fascicularis]